ncbi:uncharacterized protein LOC113520936 [Galleria mellonella]|uniref:Uncharacterized protein LOC113520936 n=1 Tax=Galleria mellonella TaxID=7137 RepID=A0ABM3MGR5_GALME|nr:uncharacterized protein LOC113520936 [Galleria mellonella]
MLLLKIAPVFLLVLIVGAEKKIELEDIEEDNLKSEKQNEIEKSDARSQSTSSSSGPGLLPFEFLKNGFLRYFESPTRGQAPQQQRYVQQYAVSEAPERAPVVTPKVQYGPPATQQAMVGYLSNVPMQIYLVPQYYNEQSEQPSNTQSAVQYVKQGLTNPAAYPSAPEAVQTQTNYVEIPTYVTPAGKTFVQQYTPPVAYVQYTAQPTVAAAHATVAPVIAYQPVMQYPTAIAAPPVVTKGYYENVQYQDGNTVEEIQENDEEIQKQYSSQAEIPYTKSPELPRYYNSRAPIREEYRHSPVPELPPPSPLLIKAPPSHLAHIPKALPIFSKPLVKSAFPSGSGHGYTQRPYDGYMPHYKRRPTSLLDSYIPSSIQIEYLKRGYTKDPLVAYEELSNGRHFSHAPVVPRHYERGFLPNQMYQTAAGGVTYGHYKRTPKVEKVTKT